MSRSADQGVNAYSVFCIPFKSPIPFHTVPPPSIFFLISYPLAVKNRKLIRLVNHSDCVMEVAIPRAAHQ